MSIDYQAHNFRCYTVQESNSEDDNCDGDDEENAMILSSDGDDDSSSTLAPSSVEEWKSSVAVKASPSWGYFVPFQPHCYFSPPVQRRLR